MCGTAVGGGEQGILSGQRKGTDAALDDVIVDLDAAVVEEQAQPLPARERVADRRGELGLLADELELGAQPGFESFDQRPAALLADRTPLLGGATDLGLDPIERCNARQRLGGDRRRARIGQLVEVPAHVAPAEGKPHVAPFGQYLVAAVAGDLQDALEAAEVRDRPPGLAVGRIDIGYTRWIGAAPWPVVPGIGEEMAGPGPASSWTDHPRQRSDCRAAVRAPAAAGTPRAPPSRPRSNGRGQRPGEHRSEPVDRAEDGRRTSIPAPGRRSPRWAARPRSGALAPAPARPRPCKRGRRI